MIKQTKEEKYSSTIRQKQLQRQNYHLKQQLNTSHRVIQSLNSQISALKSQILILQNQLNASLVQLNSPKHKVSSISPYENHNAIGQLDDKKSQRSKLSKSNKSLKLTKNFKEQLQVFTSESDQEQNVSQTQEFYPNQINSVIHPLGRDKYSNNNKNQYFGSNSKGSSTVSMMQVQTPQRPSKAQLYYKRQKGSSRKINIGSQIKLQGKSSNSRSLKKLQISPQIETHNNLNNKLNRLRSLEQENNDNQLVPSNEYYQTGQTNSNDNTIDESRFNSHLSNHLVKSQRLINFDMDNGGNSPTKLSQMNNPNYQLNKREIYTPKANGYPSAIKQQGFVIKPTSLFSPLQYNNNQSTEKRIFKKVNMAKPIYSSFFITGIRQDMVSSKNLNLNSGSSQLSYKPCINYFYPKKSTHFDAILSLCYNQEFLKYKQQQIGSSMMNGTQSQKNLSLNSSSVNNTLNSNKNMIKIKQFYVIPLRKQSNQNHDNQKQYLIICQTEESIQLLKGKPSCTFNRMYCFISECKFFNAFKNLISQFLDKLNTKKLSKYQNQNINITNINSLILTQKQLHNLYESQLQQPLLILSQKSAEENHTLNYRLDSFISLSIDIPSNQNSYKLIAEYHPWSIFNMKVHVKSQQQHISLLETKLFGIMLAYGITEKKIILYSHSKSKISQCILHFLQIIQPLQYVSPVLMASLKQQYFQYFTAPMSLILGLWQQQRKHQRQKIQIFMNRKQNLSGSLQKGKIQIPDGIIINLDTGLVYGNGLKQQITQLSLLFNDYYENYSTRPKEIYKMFDKFFGQDGICEPNNKGKDRSILNLFRKVKECIQKSQLYQYYLQKKQRKKPDLFT